MKRIACLIFAVFMVLNLAACGGGGSSGTSYFTPQPTQNPIATELEDNASLYPVYTSLTPEQRDIYVAICTAMANHDTREVFLNTYNSREDLGEAEIWLDYIYTQIVFEHPDYFWVDPYAYTYYEYTYGSTYQLKIKLNYTVDRSTATSMQTEYDNAVDQIVAGANEKAELFDKVLYVYDTILASTQYDYALQENDEACDPGRSAYGCLVEGQTVCSGYALAFTSVMQKLGIVCGNEFNSYSGFSIFSGHVWNYCQLDGEYYYFDLTWDDTCLDSEDYKPYLDHGHMYFAVTEEELGKSNYTMQTDAPTPDCSGTYYNYFIYKQLNISEYDRETVTQMIQAQADQPYAAIRFDTYGALLDAENDLMTNGGIYEIVGYDTSVTYMISKSSLHMYIFLSDDP